MNNNIICVCYDDNYMTLSAENIFDKSLNRPLKNTYSGCLEPTLVYFSALRAYRKKSCVFPPNELKPIN